MKLNQIETEILIKIFGEATSAMLSEEQYREIQTIRNYWELFDDSRPCLEGQYVKLHTEIIEHLKEEKQ